VQTSAVAAGDCSSASMVTSIVTAQVDRLRWLRGRFSSTPQEELIALVAAQAAEIAALKARLAELERRLGLNSSNSGKPPIEQALGRPSSDGLNKPPRAARTKSLRGPVTLGMSTGHSARQVFDLPEPTPLVVTEHRAAPQPRGSPRHDGDRREWYHATSGSPGGGQRPTLFGKVTMRGQPLERPSTVAGLRCRPCCAAPPGLPAR
jgi:hypothetical protein